MAYDPISGAGKKKLRRLQITEVAFVDAGGNPKADIVFAKARNVPDETPEVEQNVFNLDSIPEEFRASVQAELNRVASEAKAEVAVAKSAKPVDVASADVEPSVKVVEPAAVDISKAIEKRMDEQSAEILELRKQLADRDEREFVANKVREFSGVENIESIAKSLYKVRSDKELVSNLERVLKSQIAVSKKAKVLTEEIGLAGEGKGGDLTVVEKLDKLAREKARAEDISYAKAYARVLNENKELYNEYVEKKE